MGTLTKRYYPSYSLAFVRLIYAYATLKQGNDVLCPSFNRRCMEMEALMCAQYTKTIKFCRTHTKRWFHFCGIKLVSHSFFDLERRLEGYGNQQTTYCLVFIDIHGILSLSLHLG